MNYGCRIALLSIAMAGFVGCVGGNLRTADIVYYSQIAPVDSENAIRVPGVEITAGRCLRVVDERSRTVAEGWILPREQVRGWLVDGLEARLGMAIEYSDEPPTSGAYLALQRLYIRQVATSITGVTVLRAYGTERSRAVRGNMTRMNWNGTSREFSRVLSQSLDDAIAKLPLAAVVNRNCRSD